MAGWTAGGVVAGREGAERDGGRGAAGRPRDKTTLHVLVGRVQRRGGAPQRAVTSVRREPPDLPPRPPQIAQRRRQGKIYRVDPKFAS
jgi:hypothetical protein